MLKEQEHIVIMESKIMNRKSEACMEVQFCNLERRD